MTSAFKNETIDHCLTAYQHHIDYGKAYLISPQQNKKMLGYGNCLHFFSVRRSCFSGGENRPPPPHHPTAMHISLISTSVFAIKV